LWRDGGVDFFLREERDASGLGALRGARGQDARTVKTEAAGDDRQRAEVAFVAVNVAARRKFFEFAGRGGFGCVGQHGANVAHFSPAQKENVAWTDRNNPINWPSIMKTTRILFIFCAAIFLTSCTNTLPPLISWAHFESPLEQSFRLDETKSVVYGRFTDQSNFSFGNRIALRLRNENSKQEQLIQFKDTNSVYGIVVEPGKYAVVGFVATFFDHRTAGRRTFSKIVPFEVQANWITYFGDFSGYGKNSFPDQEWDVTNITNNFGKTTDEFRNEYPHLAATAAISVFEGQANK
jgi:hypothetical protein